jgi:GNAT superfamily N-acetyltransferase
MPEWNWVREDAPHWDGAKQKLFGDDDLAAVGLARPAPEAAVADEWWRVTGDRGAVLGYGWLDSEWGDAEIAFLVGAEHRGAGVGEFIVGRLEQEAAKRGLNYIYNTVPTSHPDRAWMTQWLVRHGFRDSGSGDLRRRVRAAAASS